MSYLAIAQYMAASAFLTIAMIHGLIWLRAHREVNHFLFAMVAFAAGTNAIAEANMYGSNTIESMSTALRWYVTTSGSWAIATVCFIAAYARVGRTGRGLSVTIVVVCAIAMAINLFSPSSFLYTEITGLREITLPWGEPLWLAIGKDNPFRLATELAFMGILGVITDGCNQLWRRGHAQRAVWFGLTLLAFMICFGTHAWFVDTGRLNSPYLSTYGFLALAGWMSYELAGEIMRTSDLSSRLDQKETELRTAVADERNRIAGDLHDSVTQTLFSTAAIADALPEVWRRSPDDAKRGLQDLKHLTRGALAEMRTLLLELHPASLVEKELGDLLKQLADATAGRTRIAVDVELAGDTNFPEDVQIALYRVAQESLNNIIKHARATQVGLSLICRDGNTTLTIRDNGHGFEQEHMPPSGMGLEVMQERVQSIGARLNLESEPGNGTTVTVYWTRTPGNNGSHER